MTSVWEKRITRLLKRQGGRLTGQRLAVARVFFSMQGHPRVSEVYKEVQKEHPEIGRATVYRTLKLLVEGGLARQRDFGDGSRHYEVVLEPSEHVHLICTICHRVVDVARPAIFNEGKEIALSMGFEFGEMDIEIFGICPDCLKKQREAK